MSALGEAWRGLFGGNKSNSSAQSLVWGTQSPYLEKLYESAEGLYDTYADDPGQLIAGLDPYQRQGNELALAFADKFPGFMGTAMDTYNNLQSGQPYDFMSDTSSGAGGAMHRAMNPTAVNINPNLPTSVLDRMTSGEVNMDPYNRVFDAAASRITDRFNNDIMPTLTTSAQAAGAGAFGSPKHQSAVGRAANTLQENLSDMGANIYGGAYNQAQSMIPQGASLLTNAAMNTAKMNEGARQFNESQSLGAASLFGDLTGQSANTQANAATMLPMLMEAGMAPAEIYNVVGGQQQDIERQKLNAPFDLLGKYQGYIGGPTTLSMSSSSGKGNTGAVNAIGSFFGGMG